jgi:glycosyltransferase involved in cell wall biosynthesis
VKVALLSWSDLASGAFIAAHRLKQALEDAGTRTAMVVARRLGTSPTTIGPIRFLDRAATMATPYLDALPTRFYRGREQTLFSPACVPDRVLPRVSATEPDVVHLHWINYGYLHPRTMAKFRKPLLWTFHDMWPMTGGCHYASGCTRYEHECGACPSLLSTRARDLSSRVWERKKAAWRGLNIAIIAPSRWMADCARRSSLFSTSRIEVIPNCLDTERFRPLDRAACRNILGLPQEAKIVLFVAMNAERDKRKGFDLLHAAACALRERDPAGRLMALVVGAESIGSDFPFPVRLLGLLRDEISLSLAYNAADVFVSASREDNLPNTVLEAMSCGTACVGFDVGGMSDLIDHQETGLLAVPEDSQDLAERIASVLSDDQRARALGNAARERVLRQNAPALVAHRHQELYRELIEASKKLDQS